MRYGGSESSVILIFYLKFIEFSMSNFSAAIQLLEALEESFETDGLLLSETCKLGGGISLWDALKTYLVLYRLPLLLSKDGKTGNTGLLPFTVKKFLPTLARFYDSYKFRRYLGSLSQETWEVKDVNTVFIFAENSFYDDLLEPVLRALDRSNRLNPVVVKIMTDGRMPEKTLDYGLFFDSKARHRHRIYLQRLQKQAQRVFTPITRRSLDKLSDRFDIRLSALLLELRWLFEREMPRLIPQIVIAESIFNRLNPKVLVNGDDADQRVRVYSLLARSRCIPCVTVQQGFTSSDYPDWKYHCCSHIACMGEESRQTLINQGVAPSIIHITGHPGFDRLIRVVPDALKEIRNLAGCKKNEKLVLFATQPYYQDAFVSPEKRVWMIRVIVNCFLNSNEGKLIIKPHPMEDANEIQGIVGESDRITIIKGKKDILPYLQASDFLITFFSQTTLLALCIGKPVINAVFKDVVEYSYFQDEKITRLAYDSEGFEKHFSELMAAVPLKDFINQTDDQYVKEFLNHRIYLQDGKAADRVAKFVISVLS